MHNWKTVLEVLFYLGCHIFIENAESAVIENAESAGTENTESAGCQPADIIFVLDSSGSIGFSDFQIEKDFVKNTVDHWDIRPNKTQVGVIVFSSVAWIEFPLNKYSDKESLQSAILDIPYIGGATNTSGALELMLHTGFSTTNGARRGGMQMGIVITDGRSNNEAKTATSAANVHKQRIFVFAIGVGGGVNFDELNDIGSDPDNDFVFLVDGFGILSHIQDVIGQKACDGWQLVNVTVNEALEHDTSLVFRCEFVPKADKFYTVTWYVDGNETMKTESLNESNMADHYLHEDAIGGPGVEISCDVTSGTAETGAMSLIGRSMELFIGIIVMTPVVNLERTGETTKQVNMTTQVPIRCHPSVSVCSFRLVQLQYSGEVCGGWDMGLSQRCQQTIDGSDVNQNITFDISIKDPAGYNLGKTEKILQLEIPSIDPDVNSLWHSYRLTDIRVQYTDGSNIWKGKECYAIVDPHFLNFDGMQFDCHLSGEFVMYKHSTMPLEIQIKTRSCLGDGASPYCICAVAIQAGRDVFIMDFCNRPPIVQVVSCGDNVLNIREVTSDGSYKIFLPTGTMVNVYKFRWSTTVTYLNVKIVPSAKDVEKTNGLCGILNGNDLDDFCVRDTGECETVQNSWDEPKEFCNSSRASNDENLFEMDSNKMKNLPPWEKSAILCMCPFSEIENNTIPGPGEADQFDCSNKAYNECDLDNLEKLKPTKFKCSIITSPQRKRREALRRQKRYTRLTSRRKRSEEERTHATISQNLTEEDAINLCTSNLKGSPLHDPCSSSIGINVNPSINNCVLDIMLTGTTAWTDAALESYSRSCINQVDMNNVVPLDGIATTTESHESSNDPRYIVYQLFCPYKCNGHGTCINGSCVCEEGFGNGDCSIDITEPPLTDDILNDGLCDTFDTDCTEVSIYGENYIDSANLTCHIKTYEITPTGGKLNEKVAERAGEYISPYEVSCGLPDLATGEEEYYVTGYSIAISNKDGIYGEDMPMYVYNSECIKPTSTGDMEYAFSKTGQCCYIDKHHHIIEDLNQSNASQICDPGRSFVDWSDKLVCQDWQYGFNCQQSCSCNRKNAMNCSDADGSCLCKEGWNGTNCEVDVDECLDDPCPDTTTCLNTDGSFSCSCGVGKVLQDNAIICVDCIEGTHGLDCQEPCQCIVNHTDICSIINGSCACKTGWEGDSCEIDIDECLTAKCMNHAKCINLNGSHECQCFPGYRKDGDSCQGCLPGSYGIDCQGVCNCSNKHTDECTTIDGTCLCEEGWAGELCEDDIDECLSNSCPSHSNCDNNIGSYTCLCHAGYQKTNGQCDGCLTGSYGIECQGVCNCSNQHTDECSTIDGTCLCEEGWSGELCEDDIDECLSNSCPFHSKCINNIGSYTCLCHAGYKKNNEQCDGCSPGSYGIDCQDVCNCSKKHTDECSTTNGTCFCDEGWGGELCEDDIDECLGHHCPSHSDCHQEIGSYTCLCHDGHRKINGQCKEVEQFKAQTILDLDIFTSPDNPNYPMLITKTESAFYQYFEGKLEDTLVDVHVTGVRSGSLITDYDVFTQTNVSSAFSRSVISLVSGDGRLMYDGSLVSVISTAVFTENGKVTSSKDSHDVCTLYTHLNQCPQDFSCEIDSQAYPSCKERFPEGSFPLYLILGFAIGVPVMLVVLWIVFFVVCKRKTTRKNGGRNSNTIAKGTRHLSIVNESCQHGAVNDRQIEYSIYSPSAYSAPLYYPTRNKSNRFGAVNRNYSQNWDDLNDYSW